MKNNDSAESNLYMNFNNDVDNYDENNVKKYIYFITMLAKIIGLLRTVTTIHIFYWLHPVVSLRQYIICRNYATVNTTNISVLHLDLYLLRHVSGIHDHHQAGIRLVIEIPIRILIGA
jgi:hypothetical protein